MSKYSVLIICLALISGCSKIKRQDNEQLRRLNSQFEFFKNLNSDSAEKIANKALSLSKKSTDLNDKAQAEYNSGICQSHALYYDNAISSLKSSANKWIQIDQSSKAGTAYLQIGTIYLKTGNIDSARLFLYKSLNLLDKSGETQVKCRLFNLFGDMYQSINVLDSAKNFYRKAVLLSVDSVLSDETAYSLKGYADACYTLNQIDSAYDYYTKSLNLYKKVNNKKETATQLCNIGNVLSDSGQYNLAETYYSEALNIKSNLKDINGILEVWVNLGVLNNDKARKMNEKSGYHKALIYYYQALPQSRNLKLKRTLMEIYHNLSTSYGNLNIYDSAYHYLDLYDSIKTQIINDKNNKSISDLLIKYQTNKKEQETQFYKASAKLTSKQLYLTVFSSVIILLLVITVFLFYRHRVRTSQQLALKNQQISNQKIDELLKQQEIKSFESMIEGQEQERKRIAEDLHDGLGILLSTVKLHFSSIEDKLDRQLVTQENFLKGATLLDEALQEVRRIAHNMSAGILTNIGLVPALQDLKETIEIGSKIRVNLFTHNLEERLDTITEIAIYRVIQELISNILKHAAASEININLNRDITSGLLTILVEDDGKGFDKNETPRKGGIGIRNIMARISRLNGKFTLDSNPGRGTTAIIEIPV
jgi:two-component system, NarL family, sensor kinase